MKFKLLSILCFLSLSIFAKNYHNQLIIPSAHVDEPSWSYCNKPIRQREDSSFSNLVEKWNQQINVIWQKLQNKIREELNIYTEQIDYYLNDQRFITAYLNYYRQAFEEFIDETAEQKIDPIVINYVHNKLHYLQISKPVKIYTYNEMDFFAYTFGTNQEGHYIILNPNFYQPENIRALYAAEAKGEAYLCIQPHSSTHNSRIIEYNNLFHLSLAIAASGITHQGDYFSKMLQIFTYNKEQLSKDTQTYGGDFTLLRGYLEACLTSKNPLEAAIFINEYFELHQEFKLLWQDFIQDIENCYNEQDLEDYYQFITEKRREIVYAQLEKEE